MQCKEQGCKAPRMKDSEFCYFHNPAIADQRRRSQSRGGRRAKLAEGPMELKTLEDIAAILTKTINRLLLADISTNKARTIGYLSNILANVIEKSDIERRLRVLEAKILT